MNKKNKVDDYIEKEFLDKDGYYTIIINLYEGFSLFNELSVGRQLEVNSEIFDYIDIKSEVIPSSYKLKVKFIGRKLEDEDKEKIKFLIKEHYYVIKEKVKRDIIKLTKKMYLLLMIGVVFLALYVLVISKLFYDSLFLELFSIIGTFSIWESFGLYIFDRKDLYEDYYNCLQNFKLNIEFEE